MKTFKYLIIIFLGAILISWGCTKGFEDANKDPNNPAEVSTNALFTSAQKQLMDDIMDEWFSGRQGLLYAQYWCQRNYPTEDRYQLRETTNSSYWRLIYTDIKDLQEVIDLNTDEATKARSAIYGDNNNQIACATILKIWALQILTDTYGDIPYFNAFKGDSETEVLNPAYDKQADIYADFLVKLKEAVDKINVDADGFLSGDIIYGGDMEKWKKFGNSLRLRIALRMSGVDKYAAANAIKNEAGIEFFTSNDDNAVFSYLGVSPNNAPIYDAYFTSGRNDFTLAKPFVNIMKGVNDTLNNKINPFYGLVDPRWDVFRGPGLRKNGMPYGISEAATKAYWSKKLCPDFYNSPSVVQSSMYTPVFMDYAEVEFILSELNGWNQTHYINGVTASLEFWRNLSNALMGSAPYTSTGISTYVASLPLANQENVLTQKYIAFYMQGYQAWAEYRRTGFPKLLVKPGETSHKDGTNEYKFTPLEDTHGDIITRVTYPEQEFVVNKDMVTAAAVSIGGDEKFTKLWWDVN